MTGSLSVAVITRDEVSNLDRCLRSVAWAAEIVVVDSFSRDATLEVARRHSARIFQRAWPGYVEQKNFALDQATGEWVLSLDADEWLTESGAEEIRRVIRNPAADAYAINRRGAFSGAFLDRTWSSDWQVRLLRREVGRFAGGRVHERIRLVPGAKLGRLRNRLPHLPYRSIRSYVGRMNRYTDLAADSLADRGLPVPWGRMLLSPPATFLKLYLLRRGFLDGVRGLVVSAGSAYSVLLKYAKLWERSRVARPDFLEAAGTTPEDPDPADPGRSPGDRARPPDSAQ